MALYEDLAKIQMNILMLTVMNFMKRRKRAASIDLRHVQINHLVFFKEILLLKNLNFSTTYTTFYWFFA